MNNKILASLAISSLLLLSGCTQDSSQEDNGPTGDGSLNQPIKVAFMPDIHFHDIYADFQDGSFQGLYNSESGDYATIRTMMSQVNSTRLFNENYFAMLAALDDVVARGIKYVALPGDFSDDGQPVHMRGLTAIFDSYSEQYGLEFFAAPGNHDPNRPFHRPGGKSDYLGEGGKEQRIFSKGKEECTGYEDDWAVIDAGYDLPTRCSEEVKEWGYQDIMDSMAHLGFYPKQEYLYFETPYSSDDLRQNYNYSQALTEASYQNRQYEICHEGTGGNYKQENYTSCSMVPDTSYLVEPIEGLWLLAIDANIYQPKDSSTGGAANPNDYEGSSGAGYNMMLTHKAHVIDWISDVVEAAKAQNKTLVSFSHFPMTDFYNGASEDIEDLFGEGAFQLERKPEDDTSKALAATGLGVHVGGHMHFNDTGVKSYNIEGQQYTLFNIQAPSLAGYIPAYKILEILPDSRIEVETVTLENVPRFNELFEHYAQEHDYLTHSGADNLWNRDILNSNSYYELTDWHIRELTRLRFLPEDWPEDIRNMLFNMNGEQMLIMSQLETDITLCQLKHALNIDDDNCESSEDNNDLLAFIRDWNLARNQAIALAAENNIDSRDMAQWNGMDLATDFYRLRNADELAFRDISPDRLPQYELLSHELANLEISLTATNNSALFSDHPVGETFKERFGSLFIILDKFATGEASDHFMIDTENGTITDLGTTAADDERVSMLSEEEGESP